MFIRNLLIRLLITLSLVPFVAANSIVAKSEHSNLPKGRQVSKEGIRHSFLLTGSKMTAIFNEKSEVIWSVKGGSRDGTVLPDGNILICESRRVVEYLKGSKNIIWSYNLSRKINKEIASAWRLDDGNTLIVENGKSPRLLEITRSGDVSIQLALQPETNNAHMQSRMARKLPNGNYLVPHLLAFSVKEYTPQGKVVRIIKTDQEELGGRDAKNWPFTAIRTSDGNTLVNLTNGNKSVIFNREADVLLRCDNEDVEGRLADPCGAHYCQIVIL